MLRLILLAALALAPAPMPRAGDVYTITMVRESSEHSTGGMTGTSSDRDAMTERVIAMRDTGLELEYDIAKPTAQDRDIAWQYPARVFKPAGGALQLLNAPEMQARADRWLKRAKLPREACGRWYFTWTAFRVNCDPQSFLPAIAALDIQPPELREGALYRDPDGAAPAPLVRKSGTTFSADLAIDPERLRESRVESDLVVAEILRKKLSREDAVRAHRAEQIAGTIAVTLEIDSTGQVWRRTRLIKLTIKSADGVVLDRAVTEVIERRLTSRGKG